MARTSSEARKKLFRAIVIVGASVGAAGCPEHGKSPTQPHGRSERSLQRARKMLTTFTFRGYSRSC